MLAASTPRLARPGVRKGARARLAPAASFHTRACVLLAQAMDALVAPNRTIQGQPNRSLCAHAGFCSVGVDEARRPAL